MTETAAHRGQRPIAGGGPHLPTRNAATETARCGTFPPARGGRRPIRHLDSVQPPGHGGQRPTCNIELPAHGVRKPFSQSVHARRPAASPPSVRARRPVADPSVVLHAGPWNTVFRKMVVLGQVFFKTVVPGPLKWYRIVVHEQWRWWSTNSGDDGPRTVAMVVLLSLFQQKIIPEPLSQHNVSSEDYCLYIDCSSQTSIFSSPVPPHVG